MRCCVRQPGGGPAVREHQRAHREDAAQARLVPRLARELDPLLHLPARALGCAAADRQVRSVMRGVSHLRLAVANVAERGCDGVTCVVPRPGSRLARSRSLRQIASIAWSSRNSWLRYQPFQSCGSPGGSHSSTTSSRYSIKCSRSTSWTTLVFVGNTRASASGRRSSSGAPAALVGAQLADDARHIRRHVLDDPDAQLDRLDRRPLWTPTSRYRGSSMGWLPQQLW